MSPPTPTRPRRGVTRRTRASRRRSVDGGSRFNHGPHRPGGAPAGTIYLAVKLPADAGRYGRRRRSRPPSLSSRVRERGAGGRARLPPCPSPGCGATMRPHAFYERSLGGELVRFLRVRCGSCRITHAVLPSDVCAWRNLLLPAWEAAMEPGRGPTASARAAGMVDAEGARRGRRIRAQPSLTMRVVLSALLQAATGDWLSRARQALGAAPGVLQRLRVWPWRTCGDWRGISRRRSGATGAVPTPGRGRTSRKAYRSRCASSPSARALRKGLRSHAEHPRGSAEGRAHARAAATAQGRLRGLRDGS